MFLIQKWNFSSLFLETDDGHDGYNIAHSQDEGIKPPGIVCVDAEKDIELQINENPYYGTESEMDIQATDRENRKLHPNDIDIIKTTENVYYGL